MRRIRARRTSALVAAGIGCVALLLMGVGLGGSVGSAPTSAAHAHPGIPRLSWHLIPAPGAPSPRDRVGFVYDPSDNYSLLYGGYDPALGTYYTTTYAYAGGAWTLLAPTSHPSAASGLRLAYDPALHGVLAFGGEGPFGSAYYNDTWLFHGGNWTNLTPTVSPPPRAQYAMAYDAVDSEIVLFGGFSGTSDLADTWTFNGTTWTHAVTTRVPEGREQASMVYDAQTQQTLLFGGWNLTSGKAPLGTWAFRGGAWKMLPATHTPLRSWTPVSALPSGTPIFFGGDLGGRSNLLNTTFEFYSGAWHREPTHHPPPPRANGGFTYDAKDGYLVAFGGIGTAYAVLNDTWTLS